MMSTIDERQVRLRAKAVDAVLDIPNGTRRTSWMERAAPSLPAYAFPPSPYRAFNHGS
jgi:hypothetical protein